MAKKKSKQTNMRNKWLFIIATFVILFIALYTILPKQTIAPIQTTNNSSSDANWIDPDPGNVANWKTYKSKFEGLSFRYPSSWKKTEVVNKTYEAITLRTPSGFEFQFISGIKYRDGGCINCTANYVEKVNIPNFKELSIVENDRGGITGVIYLSEDNEKVGNDHLNWFISSKIDPNKRDIIFQGEFNDENGKVRYFKPEEFSARPEVLTARKILRTVFY